MYSNVDFQRAQKLIIGHEADTTCSYRWKNKEEFLIDCGQDEFVFVIVCNQLSYLPYGQKLS